MNFNFLLETKQEYTIRLVNILAPVIYEGFVSIYKDACKVAKKGVELKFFQNFLRRISKWNKHLLNNETKRILNISNCSDFLEDLVRAVIKANIIILSTTGPNLSHNFLNEKQYMDIEFNHFIHMCYIESAREIYNNPYLFYHKYNPIDIKRNQRESTNLIKECIREAIRKMLPVQHILKEYLGSKYLQPKDIQVENPMSDVECKNLKNLINKDLNSKKESSTKEKLNNNSSIKKFDIENNNPFSNCNLNKKSESEKIKDFEIKNSSNNLPLQITDKTLSDKKKTSELKKFINDNSLNKNKYKNISSNSKSIKKYSIDKKKLLEKLNLDSSSEDNNDVTKIKYEIHRSEKKNQSNKNSENIIKNSLYNNVSDDSETSISYNVGNDEEYEDVFSNINNNNDISKSSDKKKSDVFLSNTNKQKNIYFNKYNKV